jgi:thiol-disulfide isomerase/thioredoxin
MIVRRPIVRPVAALLALLFLATQPLPADSTIDLAQYEGKVVLVDFWASWCVPCRRSFPWLNTMHEKYADDGLVIIGVNLDLEREEAIGFLDEFPAGFRIYFDDSKALARESEVVAMPSSYLLGRDGELRNKHFGFKVRKQDEYEAAIVAALNSLE